MTDKNKKQLLRNGFTIIEMLVTIAIIVIMSAVYLVDYRPTNEKIVLDQAASGIVADLRLAQNMAMNVKKFNTSAATSEIPQGGYGINIAVSSPGTYVLFADCNSNHIYNSASSCNSGTATEMSISRIMQSNVNISSVNFNNIDFEPPFPTIWINGAQAALLATITLQYGSSGPTRTITINRLTGQISVSN